MKHKRTNYLADVVVKLVFCTLLCSCGAAKINCRNIGVQEEDLMIVSYEINQMTRSVEENMKCMRMYLSTPKTRNEQCWRQLATTSGTQSVGGGIDEEFVTLDDSFVGQFRTLAETYNQVVKEIEIYYTSIIDKGNYEFFHEADSSVVGKLMNRLIQIEDDVDEISKKLHELTGVKPSGKWGYCNTSEKGRAEAYVLKNTKSPFYVWQPLHGE